MEKIPAWAMATTIGRFECGAMAEPGIGEISWQSRARSA
jgi:hypothetical protein